MLISRNAVFNKIAQNSKFKFYEKPRGHPDNIGTALAAVHPVVRTNPVTGWKSIFALGAYVGVQTQSLSDCKCRR